MVDFPNKKYNVILIDPPWKYRENWGNGAVKHHYETMGIDDIRNLPIYQISQDNCHLYLWVTNPFLHEGLHLCHTWGFTYKQLITWVKTYKTGEPIMGLGYYFRVCTEHCIFGVKGKLPRINKGMKNLIESEHICQSKEGLDEAFYSNQRKHSEKPAGFRDTIVKHSGDLPRIELFARERNDGWDCWGNEVPDEEQGIIFREVNNADTTR